MSLKKITGNETPRPLRGKTNKFNRLVRFVDLNESLKEVEENFIQLPSNPTTGDALVFNGTEWVPGSVGGGGDEYQETIVEISSAQILNMGSGTKTNLTELLGVDEYLDAEIWIEFTPNGTNYTGTFENLHILYSDQEYWFEAGALKSQYKAVWYLKLDGKDTVNSLQGAGNIYPMYPNYQTNIRIGVQAAPTTTILNGNGTLRAIIKYKVRTFGA
jgi:hypothetical protein